MPHPFEELLYRRVAETVSGWSSALRQDVYALCLLYGSGASADEEGKEVYYQGYVSFCYNTFSHAQEEVTRIGTNEPEWNNAYWVHNLSFFVPTMAEYGTPPNDAELQLRDSWCASVGVDSNGTDESGRPTYSETKLYRAVTALCGRVVRRLHEDGTIATLFGKPVPIVIEMSDWSDDAVADTKESNPLELLKGYLQWIYERWG